LEIIAKAKQALKELGAGLAEAELVRLPDPEKRETRCVVEECRKILGSTLSGLSMKARQTPRFAANVVLPTPPLRLSSETNRAFRSPLAEKRFFNALSSLISLLNLKFVSMDY
jgi:hypothetical protein